MHDSDGPTDAVAVSIGLVCDVPPVIARLRCVHAWQMQLQLQLQAQH